MRARPPTALLVILAVALLVRVGVIVATPDFEPIFDAADYERHAISLADGDGFGPSQFAPGPTAFRPPLYPVALAVVQAVGGGWTAERLLGALLGVATVLLIYLLAARLFDRRAAIVAGGIAAVFPPLVLLNASLLSEALFLPLVLAAVLATLEYRDTRLMRWVVLAGVLSGLAILTRTTGVPVVLALALGAWITRPRFSRAGLAAPAVLVLAAVLTVTPWVIRNTAVFDRWVGLSTGSGYALAGTYSEESEAEASAPGQPFSPNQLDTYKPMFEARALDEAEFTSELNDDATEYIGDNPGYVVETVVWNVLRVLELRGDVAFDQRFATSQTQAAGLERLDSPVLFRGSIYLVLALALLGVAAQSGLLPARRAPLFVWAVPILLLLPALVIYGIPRYRAPIDPFLVMLAAVGAVAAFDRWVSARLPRTDSQDPAVPLS